MGVRSLILGSSLVWTGCQFASGLSELHATSRPEMTVDGSELTCESDADCTDADESRCLVDRCVDDEIAAQWICNTPELMTANVRYTFRVIDFITREPAENVTVKACRFNDVGCSAPVDTFVDTRSEGSVHFELPNRFTGFFEITSAALPVLLYVTKPISRNAVNRDVPVLTFAALELTAKMTGYTYDPDKGVVLLEAIKCDERPSGGIRFELHGAADAEQFYLVDQIPTKDADVTVYDPNNDTANGGFINVPPGSSTFSAYLGRDGLKLQTFNAQVRAGAITFIDMTF